jgi:SAM-dependent methyltransferase
VEQSPDDIRRCYDAVAREYAEKFDGELAHKPLDRELLRRFAEEIGPAGTIYDLGCGPGQTTAFLQECGADVCGIDLSPELIAEARRRHPGASFEVGDILDLPLGDEVAAGIVAFYAIVHFSAGQLRQALAEMGRVLRPGGRLLLAFHIGREAVHVEEFLGRAMSLDFEFFEPAIIREELSAAGFTGVEVVEREAYPVVEYPSRRAYVFATKSLACASG